MPIVYVDGRFEIHGLSINTEAEFEAVMDRFRAALRRAHPCLQYDTDVMLDVEERAGTPDEVKES